MSLFILQHPVKLRNASTEIIAFISKTAYTGKYIGHKISHFSLQLSFKTFFSSEKFILADFMWAEMQTHTVTGGMRSDLKRKFCERISKASTHNIVETIRFESEHRACDFTSMLAARKVN
jgi:hypothetical protein